MKEFYKTEKKEYATIISECMYLYLISFHMEFQVAYNKIVK